MPEQIINLFNFFIIILLSIGFFRLAFKMCIPRCIRTAIYRGNKNIYSILPIIAAMIYLYFVWNGNELKVKKCAFYCYFLWLVYNICVFSIAGITSNIVSIISTFIAVYNEKRVNKSKEIKENG